MIDKHSLACTPHDCQCGHAPGLSIPAIPPTRSLLSSSLPINLALHLRNCLLHACTLGLLLLLDVLHLGASGLQLPANLAGLQAMSRDQNSCKSSVCTAGSRQEAVGEGGPGWAQLQLSHLASTASTACTCKVITAAQNLVGAQRTSSADASLRPASSCSRSDTACSAASARSCAASSSFSLASSLACRASVSCRVQAGTRRGYKMGGSRAGTMVVNRNPARYVASFVCTTPAGRINCTDGNSSLVLQLCVLVLHAR